MNIFEAISHLVLEEALTPIDYDNLFDEYNKSTYKKTMLKSNLRIGLIRLSITFSLLLQH